MNKLIACLSALFFLVSFSVAYAASDADSDVKNKTPEEQKQLVEEILADVIVPGKAAPDWVKLQQHCGNAYGSVRLSTVFKDIDTSVVIGFYEHESSLVRSAVDGTLQMRRNEATEAITHALETTSPRVRFQLLCFQNNRYNYINKPTAEMCAMLDIIIHDEKLPVFNTDHKIVARQCYKNDDWCFDIIGYCNRLLDSESINDRETAINLLHTCDDISGSVPRLISILKNPDKNDESNSMLKKTINILGRKKQSPTETIPIFNKYLRHKDESVQLLASRMLYRLDHERDKQARFIIGKFKENQTADTFSALRTIGKDGSELIPFIKELLKSEDKSIRSQARRAFTYLGGSSDDILDMMKLNLTSNNTDERNDTISYFRNKSFVPEIADYLLETLKKENIDNELKYELCSMLISKKGMFEDILPSIIELLNTRYPEELSVKAANLLKYGGIFDENRDVTSAMPALLAMMESEDSAVMKQIREVIIKIEDDPEIVVNKLIELVENSNDKICLNAISQLGYMKENSINSIGALADAHNRDNETIKTNSILAIRTILQTLKHNQKVNKADLLKVMEINDSRITGYATKELINRFEDYDGIIAQLLTQAKNSDDKARGSIFSTIGKMGNKALSALPTLHKYMLKDKSHRSSSYYQIKKIVESTYPSTEIDIPTFLNLLECKDTALVKDVIGVLIAHDCDYEKITGKLVEIMQNKDSKYRENAIRELGNLGKNAFSALPALVEMHGSNDYSLKRDVLAAINQIFDAYGPDNEVTIPFIISMLESNDKDYCEKALNILSFWGAEPVHVLPVLTKLLKDDKRTTANYGYNKVERKRVSGTLFSIIMRMDSKTKVDPEFLLELLELDDGRFMALIADKYMLLTDDYSKLIKKLVGFIEHGDDTVREKAINTFTARSVKLKDAVPALKQILNRVDDDRRERIIRLIDWIEKKNKAL